MEAALPQCFQCPITQGVMLLPVISPYGHSYEENALLDWLETHSVDPMTNQPLSRNDIGINRSLQDAICEACRQLLNDPDHASLRAEMQKHLDDIQAASWRTLPIRNAPAPQYCWYDVSATFWFFAAVGSGIALCLAKAEGRMLRTLVDGRKFGDDTPVERAANTFSWLVVKSTLCMSCLTSLVGTATRALRQLIIGATGRAENPEEFYDIPWDAIFNPVHHDPPVEWAAHYAIYHHLVFVSWSVPALACYAVHLRPHLHRIGIYT